jgi:hypothetical protein
VNTGLGQVDQLAVGRGFVDVHAGVSSELGAFGRVEAGFKPAQDLDLFGFGEASTGDGVQAGIGARFSF